MHKVDDKWTASSVINTSQAGDVATMHVVISPVQYDGVLCHPLLQGRLVRLLQASDIFVMAYSSRSSTNSGTMSMAMAAGKVVIATPFEHARDVLPNRGILVEYDDVWSLQEAIIRVIGNRPLQLALSKAAFDYAKELSWSNVANQYVDLLNHISLAP